jgi:hypothetical protein
MNTPNDGRNGGLHFQDLATGIRAQRTWRPPVTEEDKRRSRLTDFLVRVGGHR